MKRIALLFLCAAVLFSVAAGVVSCKPKQNTPVDSETISGGNGSSGGSAGGDPTDPEAALYGGLKQANYSVNGFATEFNILSNWAEDKDAGMMDTDDLTTTFSSAIYSRNRFVEEQLGVLINWTPETYGNVRNKLQQLNAAGDYQYDIVYNESYFQSQSVLQDVYKSVNTYSQYLDFNKPWWYSDVLEDLSLADNSFLVAGALNMTVDDMIWCVAFNTKTVSDFGAESPFDYVYDNEWTWENFYKLSKDTRSEGKYGIVSHYQMADALFFGAGLILAGVNEDGELERTSVNDRFVTIYQDMVDKFFENNGVGGTAENCISSVSKDCEMTTKYDWAGTGGASVLFSSGNATFWVTVTNGVKRNLPPSDIEYGVVPTPKYEAGQEKYIGWVSRPAAVGGITATINNQPEGTIERVCTVLEWLSAYSHKLVRPAYYDVILLGRVPRQAETKEMLNIVFGLDERGMRKMDCSATFDLGMVETLEISALDCKPDISGILRGNAKVIDDKISTVYEYYRAN